MKFGRVCCWFVLRRPKTRADCFLKLRHNIFGPIYRKKNLRHNHLNSSLKSFGIDGQRFSKVISHQTRESSAFREEVMAFYPRMRRDLVLFLSTQQNHPSHPIQKPLIHLPLIRSFPSSHYLSSLQPHIPHQQSISLQKH
jgi:hypothetical protein